jgi:D-threonate/D-erythronate kinase
LTGALECGAKFAAAGFAAWVTTSATALPDVEVLVVDTETRHVSTAAAYEAVARIARQFNPGLIYKKTDSTLRGNIAAEFRALLDVFPDRELIYAPAYPDMGRTVRAGMLFVHGTPVHETAFANDPLNPILNSSIHTLLAGLPVTLLDGDSNEDIALAARTIVSQNPRPIAAGPAALAQALVACLGHEHTPEFPRLSRCLVVNGSLHPASAAQIESARHADVNGWRILDHNPAPEKVRHELATNPYDGLIVFGGDTAFAIHRALNAPAFEPIGEVLPGVPLSRCGDLTWITKAGGFGPPDLLLQLQRCLAGDVL